MSPAESMVDGASSDWPRLAGTTAATMWWMNVSMCFCPSLPRRNPNATLKTSASIGTNANKLEYASAAARTGTRLRVKLLTVSTQK